MSLMSPYKMNSGHNKYNKTVTLVRKTKIKGDKVGYMKINKSMQC